MDVYVVPVGSERYELYCESADDHEPVAAHEEAGGGVLKRLQSRFSQVLAAIEREYEREVGRKRAYRHPSEGLFRRLRTRLVRWLAERVAEQRLLWKLRRQTRVCALYPTQLDEAAALRVIHRTLRHDADSHGRWLVLDGVGLLLSALLAPFPGPNLIAYYFIFRVVGHFLSMRGAKQGLRHVEWRLQPSAPLSALAALDGLTRDERLERVQTIQRELGLTKLARFFERTSVRAA